MRFLRHLLRHHLEKSINKEGGNTSAIEMAGIRISQVFGGDG